MIGDGESLTAAAAACGVNRKTVYRWRAALPGFGDALDRVLALSADGSPRARREVENVVRAWAPSGVPEREHESALPDVLGRDGRVLVSGERVEQEGQLEQPGGQIYTSKRPPTRDEWIAMMTDLALDPAQPDRLRLGAMASVSTALGNGPAGRAGRASDRVAELQAAEQQEAAQREKGRDAGIPASVWHEARQNFLGPPAAATGEAARPTIELVAVDRS